MDLLAHGDAHRVAAAEERVAACVQQLLKAAFALDHALAARDDQDGLGKLVDGARRLAATV